MDKASLVVKDETSLNKLWEDYTEMHKQIVD